MYFTIEKIVRQMPGLKSSMYRHTVPITQFKFFEGDCAGAEQPEFDDSRWADFHVGDYWGGYDVTAWFRTRVQIPRTLPNEKLALRFVVGPRDDGDSTAETLLYVNGLPLQGLDLWHEEAWLPPEHLRQNEISVALKAWSGVVRPPDHRRFKEAALVAIDEDAECLYYLTDTIINIIDMLDENDLRTTRLLQALNEAFLHIDFARPRSPEYYLSLAEAGILLSQRVEELYRNDEIKPRVIGIGHAHLDMAWLWRLRHTREKAARTFSTALNLMRQCPEYHFLHTSPQLYQFLKQDYPVIFERVKERIAAGQWEINGGMWVEADTNLPSGESLVRQILLGKQFTRAEFGVETRVLWMPDVFGYSAALPQIMRKSGLDSIMTTKISWNQFNRFPYDTFDWRGIDGSKVLAHFITTPELNSRSYSYNGEMTPFTVKGIWDQYKQKEINDELLLCFGAGDGGGGPTKEALEAASAMKAIPGLPQVELGSAEDYFERLHKRLEDKELPVWDGELYLEYHRGTYTSQAANKRANRKSEILYHDAEFYNALTDTLTGQHRYPAAELREGWEKILLNQFHDILPGSSIRQVYQDSQQDYSHISEIGERAVRQAKRTLYDRIPTKTPSAVVLNSLGWRRDALVELPWTEEWKDKTIADAQGQSCESQVVEENGRRKVLFQTTNLPPLGYRVYPVVAAPLHSASEPMVITRKTLENKFYRITLDERGQMTSLFDKVNQREVLAAGARANVLQVFDDRPMAFDAWDIDIFYQEKMKEVDDLIEAVVEETGPLRGVLRLRWHFRDSEITQRITLYRDSPRIDFRTWIDWHESQQLLKVAFPVAIRSTRATYDIQFGNVERPTHWNTSWDLARFEVVAHKWADLSEGDYGVSLLNDCKYGYDVKNNVIRLTLLKSAVRPDDFADRGQHEFTYALLPHKGDWREGRTVEQAYALNYPAHASFIAAPQTGDLPDEYAFASVDKEGVIVETIKQAEDGQAWIVRLYESTQCRHSAVKMTFGQPIRNAVECNLLEEDEQPARFADRNLVFAIAPYEIKTFKIWF